MTGPPSRRTKPSKGDRTSQAILDAAERLLSERDLSAITIDDLTSGAGISRSTFYFHFDSRDAVLLQLAEQLVEQLYASAGAWISRDGEPPATAVHRAVEQTVALWRSHGPVLRAAVMARETDPRMREFWDGVARRFIGSIAELIERERAAGLALPGPPSASRLAAVLVSMNEEVCFHQARARRSAIADREIVDALTTVWMRAVYGTAQE